MKPQLQLCSLALNPSSPSPFACLVKVEDGFMVSYGGLFCLRTPLPIAIDACFNPVAVAPFFRKERGTVSYTLKNGKLVLKEGKESLTVKCLAAEEMATIDNIETPISVALDTTFLKKAADVINVQNTRPWAVGVTFREGGMYSTNNAVFFSGESGLPDELTFSIHRDACVALSKFKGKIVKFSHNRQTVKFIFDDGSSLCAHLIVSEMPDVAFLYDGDWNPLNLTEDLTDLNCSDVEFKNGDILYSSPDSEGIFEKSVDLNIKAKVTKKNFDYLLKLGNKISLSRDGNRLKSVGEKCTVICGVTV